jgi:hypothetical protein
MDWEARVADLWASFDSLGEADFLARMDALAEATPPAVAAYERGSAFDSTGDPDRAVPLCRCGAMWRSCDANFGWAGVQSRTMPDRASRKRRSSATAGSVARAWRGRASGRASSGRSPPLVTS